MGKLWSKRQRVATETFQCVIAGPLTDPANNVAISGGNDASAGTVSFVVKYFCQRIHLCNADHLAVCHQVDAKKRASPVYLVCALDRSLLWMKSDQSMRFYFGSFCAKAFSSRFHDGVDLIVYADPPHAEVCRSVCTSRRGVENTYRFKRDVCSETHTRVYSEIPDIRTIV